VNGKGELKNWRIYDNYDLKGEGFQMGNVHPIWKTVHWVCIIPVVGVAMYFNATAFDETELKALAQIAIALGGWFGVQHMVERKARKVE
jgi:hypothetical protein